MIVPFFCSAALVLHTPLTLHHVIRLACACSKLDLSPGKAVTIFLLGVHSCAYVFDLPLSR